MRKVVYYWQSHSHFVLSAVWDLGMRLVHTCTTDLSTVSTEVILGQDSRLLTYCALLPQPCTQTRSHFPHMRKSWILGIGTCRLGHSPGYFESCVLISQGPDTKTHGHQHIAYADV